MTHSNNIRHLFVAVISYLLFAAPIKAAEPSLLFTPSVLTSQGDTEIVATIIINTAGQGVGGAGARLIFDPYYLTAVRVFPGTIFTDYPATIIDNTNGTITISGIASSPTDLFNGEGEFADIVFRSYHAGTSKITFLFTPGSTTDSNIAVMTGNGDILSKVNDLTVTTSMSSDNVDTTDIADTTTTSPSEVLSLIKSQNTMVKTIAGSLGLSKVADQYASARPGRSAIVVAADPMAPITRQDPITDPSTNQPEAITVRAVKTTTPSYVISVLIGVIIILIGIIIWYALKRRDLPPTPPFPINYPQSTS